MELVIFDLDGVIVSTDHLHFQSWKRIAESRNLRFDYEMNHMLRGVSRVESFRIILEQNEVNLSGEEFAEDLFSKNEMYKQSLATISPDDTLPGVLDLLKDLRENSILIGIGSSSKNAPRILQQLQLDDAFDVVIDGNQIEHSKPHPEVFSKGAEALNIDSADCVVFEDASAGVEAALAAKMVVVGCGAVPLKKVHYMAETLEGLNTKILMEINKNRRLI